MITNIICQGCFLKEPIKYIKDGDLSAVVNWTTSDVAERAGWVTTRHIRFSSNREVIWLCPACAKAWNDEVRIRVRNLLQILDRTCENTYIELLELGASDEEFKEFAGKLSRWIRAYYTA